MLNEFKEFAVKGNMVDMAVGIIIGAAFGTVVTSLVSDIITPLIAWVSGSPDFSNLVITLREAVGEAEAVTIGIGTFINAVVSFLIVAWVLFIIVKGVNKLKKEQEAAA